MKLLRFILMSILCLGCAGCPVDGDTDDSIAFEIVTQGIHSGIHSERFMVIESQSELDALWNDHLADGSTEDIPVIDFVNERLIAIFVGNYPGISCGVTLGVPRITKSSGIIHVVVGIVRPMEDLQCFLAEEPFILVKVTRTDGFITFDTKIS